MKNATPTETANYITNTGCDFNIRRHGSPWCLPLPFEPEVQGWIEAGWEVKIRLTPYGLPSHLPPHNPAGLSAEQITEGGKYRAVTKDECDGRHDEGQYYCILDSSWTEGFIDDVALTYRLPADTAFPDWEEMSKAKPAKISFAELSEILAKESLTPRPATEESSAPQPAPGETPETNALDWSVAVSDSPQTSAAMMRNLEHAQNLERQRNQARRDHGIAMLKLTKAARELAAQGKRIGELEDEGGSLHMEITLLNRRLDEANADRVRLRKALEAIAFGVRPTKKPGGAVQINLGSAEMQEIAEAALSTPPPEMVSKAEHAKILEEYDRMEKTLIACASDSAAVMVNMMRGTIAKLSLQQWLSLNGLEHPPGYVPQSQYDTDIAMMNERATDRTSGMLDGQVRIQQMPSAMSFRAGWAACIEHEQMSLPDVEQALREHMAENEPKGKTLAELTQKDGETCVKNPDTLAELKGGEG